MNVLFNIYKKIDYSYDFVAEHVPVVVLQDDNFGFVQSASVVHFDLRCISASTEAIELQDKRQQ